MLDKMQLPQLTSSLETSSNSSDVLSWSCDSSYSESDMYSSSSCLCTLGTKITINRAVNTSQATDTTSGQVPYQNLVIPQLASKSSKSSISSYSSDSFYSPLNSNYSENYSHYSVTSKDLINSKVTTRYAPDTALEVGTGTVIDTYLAADINRTTDSGEATVTDGESFTLQAVSFDENADTKQASNTGSAIHCNYSEKDSHYTVASKILTKSQVTATDLEVDTGTIIDTDLTADINQATDTGGAIYTDQLIFSDQVANMDPATITPQPVNIDDNEATNHASNTGRAIHSTYSENDRYYTVASKIVINSQVTTRYITDTDLEVNTGTVIDTDLAAGIDQATDTCKATDTGRLIFSDQLANTSPLTISLQAVSFDENEARDQALNTDRAIHNNSSKSDSHYTVASKILINSQVTTRYATDTNLEVDTGTVINTDLAEGINQATDTCEATDICQLIFSDQVANTDSVTINLPAVRFHEDAVTNYATGTDQVKDIHQVTELEKKNAVRHTFDKSYDDGKFESDIKSDMHTISLTSISSTLLDDLQDADYWERISCCSNYSGASNTTFSLNTELLSIGDFPSSD